MANTSGSSGSFRPRIPATTLTGRVPNNTRSLVVG